MLGGINRGGPAAAVWMYVGHARYGGRHDALCRRVDRVAGIERVGRQRGMGGLGGRGLGGGGEGV